MSDSIDSADRTGKAPGLAVQHSDPYLRERLIELAVRLGPDINHTKQAAEWEKYITTGEPTEWTKP